MAVNVLNWKVGKKPPALHENRQDLRPQFYSFFLLHQVLYGCT